MNNTKVDEIEVDLNDAKEMVEDLRALERLQSNKDFVRIINKGYLETHAMRQVHLKASPAMEKPDMQARVIREIDAIGSFRQYLVAIERLGATAEKNVAEYEKAREEMLEEELAQ